MIYITGDTHGQLARLEKLEEYLELQKGDYLIICGDFGFIYYDNFVEELILNSLSQKNYTILFIDGNHENFPAIFRYPEEQWNGGKIHRIRENIIHLMRGQVFEIDGKSIFTFGGALSVDRAFRKLNISYWDEEVPNISEILEAKQNLEKCNGYVDYIITHTVPTSVKNLMHYTVGENDADKDFTDFLDEVRIIVNYKKWFAGHFHINRYATESDNIKILYEGTGVLI